MTMRREARGAWGGRVVVLAGPGVGGRGVFLPPGGGQWGGALG
ncbi:hypothetical protein FB33_1190, partial [Cutibacterium acnes]